MLKIVLFSLLCGYAFSAELPKPFFNIDHAHYYFRDFELAYNKHYANEKAREERLKIFTENLKSYNKLNSADRTAVYGVDQFSDLTREEFARKYTGLVVNPSVSVACRPVRDSDVVTNDAPAAFDWRARQAVTPIKNQGACGSCYAFSSAGVIESLYAIKNGGVMLDLSEQQLVDCSKVNGHCEGGFMTQSLSEVVDMGGINLESDYPYKAVEGKKCLFNKPLAKVHLSECINVNLQDENKLKEYLFKTGPVSVAVAASTMAGYRGGIISVCNGQIDHAVLLVGYGTENGQDFWIIKNSWGSTWGEQGYVRILRGRNMCSIMNPLGASCTIA